jgi:AraC-like DNA-binding protein
MKKRLQQDEFLIDFQFIKNPKPLNDVRLYQIGKRFCNPNASILPHLHVDWYELTVVTDGEADVITNGNVAHVVKGDIHLSFPCDAHRIISSEREALRYDFFSFYTTNEKYNEKLGELVMKCPADGRVFQSGKTTQLVSEAIAELEGGGQFFEQALEAIFNQIVVYTLRNTLLSVSERSQKNVSDAQMLCYRIMNYIDTNIFDMKSLDELSSALKYNYAYLSSVFKKTTGNTVLSYYQRKRLECARLILLEENAKIGEVSESLGYSSPYSFSRAFKEAYGTSPKKYVKSHSSS